LARDWRQAAIVFGQAAPGGPVCLGWLYLAGQISLKPHHASYRAFPYVLRSGGLITALGPKVGRKAEHPDTHDVTLACAGFNDKNDCDRQTPCDRDFLRKLARHTQPSRLHAWFNREVPRCLRSLRLFDGRRRLDWLFPDST